MQQSDLINKLEKEIAELLLTKLEHLDIPLDRASAIAKFTLKSLPDGLTDDQVRQIIPKLDDEFVELADIVYKHMVEFEEKYKKPVVLDEVNELVKNKHFDQANKLMKDYFSNSRFQ